MSEAAMAIGAMAISPIAVDAWRRLQLFYTGDPTIPAADGKKYP